MINPRDLHTGISMVFWFFLRLDHRLYKQSLKDDLKDTKSMEIWTLIADTSSQWTDFTASLSGSRNRNDKKLFSYLSGVLEDVIPFLKV